VKAGDWDTAKTIAHQVAGTGASYGFPELSELSSQLQRLLGDPGDPDRAAAAAAAEALIRALMPPGERQVSQQ